MEVISDEIREDLIRLHNRTRTSHIGSEFSCIDLLVELYWYVLDITPSNMQSLDRDYFILSKGHAAPALYDVLYRRGFISKETFESYGINGTILAEHPSSDVNGISSATGSLGHGLSIASGIAYSLKEMGLKRKVYVLLSDGECQEGATIEASIFAGRMKLDNLIAIVDNNGLQGFERTSNIQSIKSVMEKFSSSNWRVREIDGHNHDQIRKELSNSHNIDGKPTLIIANTIKGKGVNFMEDKLEWHYKSPSDSQVSEFISQLHGVR